MKRLNPPRCVVVDSSIAIVRALEVILTGLGWEARVTAFSGNAFTEVLRSPTSLLITGLRPSKGCGLRLIEALRQRGWMGRVVILTTTPERVAASLLRELDVAAVLKKPFKLEGLREAVEGTGEDLNRRGTREKLRENQIELGWQEARRRMDRLARAREHGFYPTNPPKS